jgi:hypothetical protein
MSTLLLNDPLSDMYYSIFLSDARDLEFISTNRDPNAKFERLCTILQQAVLSLFVVCMYAIGQGCRPEMLNICFRIS